MKKILVVDDEENIRELIKFNLEKAGYQVLLAKNGQEALDVVGENISLIILDLMLPEIDGLSVCRQLKSQPKLMDIPIIMLTAKGEELDRILGLEMGADDYMSKPFSPRELVARIKAVLRRIEPKSQHKKKEKTEDVIKREDLELNLLSHELKKNGKLLELTPKEFALLKIFMLNSNKVLTRDLLLDKIWGYDYFGDTRTVDVHIRRLRKKIGSKYIKTIRGVGYKFAKLV